MPFDLRPLTGSTWGCRSRAARNGILERNNRMSPKNGLGTSFLRTRSKYIHMACATTVTAPACRQQHPEQSGLRGTGLGVDQENQHRRQDQKRRNTIADQGERKRARNEDRRGELSQSQENNERSPHFQLTISRLGAGGSRQKVGVHLAPVIALWIAVMVLRSQLRRSRL